MCKSVGECSGSSENSFNKSLVHVAWVTNVVLVTAVGANALADAGADGAGFVTRSKKAAYVAR